MLQHQEIKRLKTQIAGMPQAATAAAMAEIQTSLDAARSHLADRKEVEREKNLTIKSLQSQLKKHGAGAPTLAVNVQDTNAQLEDSLAQLADAKSEKSLLKQQNSELQAKLGRANGMVVELKRRSDIYREECKNHRRHRKRARAKWNGQLADFESRYKAMLGRKQRDTKGFMDEISTLIQTTTTACGRNEAEATRLAAALASVKLELSHRESELAAGR